MLTELTKLATNTCDYLFPSKSNCFFWQCVNYRMMKYWRGIYFGGLADFLVSANIKSAINLAIGIC